MAKASKKGLGTGLSALFGDSFDDAAPKSEETKEILELPISKVEPRREQPRYSFDEVALAELSELKNTKGGSMALDLLIQTNEGSRFRWRVPFDLSQVPAEGCIDMGKPNLWRGY